VIQEPIGAIKGLSILCVLSPLKKVILSFHLSYSTFFLPSPEIQKLTSVQNCLMVRTLVLLAQIKWFTSQNWSSERELSPHFRITSLRVL